MLVCTTNLIIWGRYASVSLDLQLVFYYLKNNPGTILSGAISICACISARGTIIVSIVGLNVIRVSFWCNNCSVLLQTMHRRLRMFLVSSCYSFKYLSFWYLQIPKYVVCLIVWESLPTNYSTLLDTFLAQIVHLHGCIFHECTRKSSIPLTVFSCISCTVSS
jgi:hypothetical protein